MCILPGNLMVDGLKKILPYEKYDVPSFTGLTRAPLSLPNSSCILLLFALSIKYGNVKESPSSVSTKSGFMFAISFISLANISTSESSCM